MIARFYQQLKNVYHYFQAHAWRLVYGCPDKGLVLYGVTGTNGKTTTCHIVAAMLQAAHGEEKVGMLTTIAFWIGTTQEINATKMTTLDSKVVYRYLRQMRRAGVSHVVIEITSHALDQHRLAGLKLRGAIILNIAREHLDYHHTMQEYAAAKAKIVQYLQPGAPLILKGDDEWVARIARDLKTQNPNVKTIKFTTEQARPVHTPLPGEVNKENVVAATLLTRALGIGETAITTGVQRITHVPGRMESIVTPWGATVIIDYAVTPDALDRLYHHVRSTTPGKIFAVLGAAGLRDRGKRPDMARVVAQYSDELIMTREDPWTESEEQIFSDLEQGVRGTTKKYQRIIDRQEALRYCIGRAQRGDVVVVTGKGAEVGMGVGKNIIPWNDRQVIEELIAAKSH